MEALILLVGDVALVQTRQHRSFGIETPKPFGASRPSNSFYLPLPDLWKEGAAEARVTAVRIGRVALQECE